MTLQGKSKAKGTSGEKEVIACLQPIVDNVYMQHNLAQQQKALAAIRTPILQRNLSQCRDGGHDIIGLPWAAIEVKKCKVADMPRWWAQTIEQAGQAAAAKPGVNVYAILCYQVGRQEWRARWPAGIATNTLTPQGTYVINAAIVDTPLPMFARWLDAELRNRLSLASV